MTTKNYLPSSAIRGRGTDKIYYLLGGKGSTRNMFEENENKIFHIGDSETPKF